MSSPLIRGDKSSGISIPKGNALSKRTIAAGIAAAGVAALAAGAAFAPVATAANATNSAYAVSASGLVKIDKTPFVTDEKGFNQESLVELGKDGQLVHVKALNALAGENIAKASVAQVKLDLSVLKGLDLLGKGHDHALLSATAISASCENGKGKAAVANASIAGIPLKVDAPVNTVVEVPGIAKVTLNKQTKNADDTLTVTALSVDLLNGTQKIDLASATCSTGAPSTPTTQPTAPTTGGNTTLPAAPTPKPVKAHLSVTG
jgi:hypothetical protein